MIFDTLSLTGALAALAVIIVMLLAGNHYRK